MGFGTIGLVEYEYSHLRMGWLTSALSVLIAACYLRLIVLGLDWGWGPEFNFKLKNPEHVRGKFVRTIIFLGCCWAFLFINVMCHANGEGRALLYALIVGLISMSALVAPLSAALAFWVPNTIAGFISFGVSDAADFAVMALLAGYTLLTLFCQIYLNLALIRRVVGEINQLEGRETIGLLLRDFEESVSDWLWETDQDGRLTYVSTRFAAVAQTTPGKLTGAELVAVLGLTKPETSTGPGRRATDQPNLIYCLKNRLPFRDVSVVLTVGSDSVCWSLTGKPKIGPRQTFEGYRGVGSDITQSMHANDRARFLAHYDELTGLANRRLFREILEAHCNEAKDQPVALLCLDLDRFKAVNDSYGHSTGDALLVAVARRLQDHVGADYLCARLGGDEFAVVLQNAAPEFVTEVANRLVIGLSRPYQLDELQVEVGATIGIAFASSNFASSTALFRNADTALYQAKADGRGRARFYDRELSDRDLLRSKMQTELRDAIDNDDFHVHFQPIFSLANGQVTAVEALMRWNSPSHGPLSAGDFIPLAESCGLIESLGEQMLARACSEGRHLPASVRIAVNVSPLQLHSDRFISHLRQVLDQSGLSPSRLELELTETALFDMSAQTLGMLREIDRMGVHINLDDFGVGHTSLGQLRKFPFSTLKIDQSFIQDLPANASARVIVRGLASMASELGIRTVAEGIETFEQLELIRQAGCDEAQGFFLAKPMSAQEVSRFTSINHITRGYVEAPLQAPGKLLVQNAAAG